MADGRHLRDAADGAGFPGGSDEQQPPRPLSHEIGAIRQKTERAGLVERTGDPLGDELRPLGKNELCALPTEGLSASSMADSQAASPA